MQSFLKRNRKDFIVQCLKEREQFNIPPFSFMTALIFSGASKASVEAYANKLVNTCMLDNSVDILGPVEAPMFLIRGKYRYRVLLKGSKRSRLNEFTRKMIANLPPPSTIRLTIDVDPYTFM